MVVVKRMRCKLIMRSCSQDKMIVACRACGGIAYRAIHAQAVAMLLVCLVGVKVKSNEIVRGSRGIAQGEAISAHCRYLTA